MQLWHEADSNRTVTESVYDSTQTLALTLISWLETPVETKINTLQQNHSSLCFVLVLFGPNKNIKCFSNNRSCVLNPFWRSTPSLFILLYSKALNVSFVNLTLISPTHHTLFKYLQRIILCLNICNASYFVWMSPLINFCTIIIYHILIIFYKKGCHQMDI